GGDGFETRVVDGMLQIRARSAMLGYLNAPSPFTSDGWLPTGDAVDVDGEYLRIRGRHSEIINVGGEKVYPAEVESVLQSMEGVKDVTVGSEPNPISGQIVTARVKLATGERLFEVDGRPAGFVAYTSRSITFHREAIRRHWAYVAWLIALSVVRDPRLVARLLKAARLMFSRRAELDLSRDPLGEVLAIGVLPEYRTPEFLHRTGLRIGEELIVHVMSYFRSVGVDRLRMVVEAHNKPA